MTKRGSSSLCAPVLRLVVLCAAAVQGLVVCQTSALVKQGGFEKAEGAAADSENHQLSASAWWKGHRAALAAAYLLAGLGLRLASGRADDDKSRRAVGCVAGVWAGFVLAISFCEAWVKFRAPLLPRCFALEVGRTVFPALNVVEAALCATLWSFPTRRSVLMTASLVLLAQIALLTPRLASHSETAVLAALRAHPDLVASSLFTDIQRARFKKLQQKEDAAASSSSSKTPASTSARSLHLLYIPLEVLKLACLFSILLPPIVIPA